MLEELEYYVDLAKEAVTRESEKERTSLYSDIDDAVNCVSPVPSELRSIEWIKNDRVYTSTLAANARNASTRTFASKDAQFEISPLSDDEGEYERTEALETAMGWDYKRMNSIGSKSDHWKIVESAMTYGAVAVNTEDVYRKFKGRTDAVAKAARRGSRWRWHDHHPGTVHPLDDDYGHATVVKRSNLTVSQIVSRYGEDNPGVSAILGEIRKRDAVSMQAKYSLWDLTDRENRVIWAASGGQSNEVRKGHQIMREPHGMPFIPWVIVDYGDAMLKSLIKSGLWKQYNIMLTMRFALAIEMVAHSRIAIVTPDGSLDYVDIDNTHPSQPMVLRTGSEAKPLPPPAIDSQFLTVLKDMEAEGHETTVASILASVEKYAGSNTFSTVTAMLKGAAAQLAIGEMTASEAERLAYIQNFLWIDYTDNPFIAYRASDKEMSGNTYKRGSEIAVYPPSQAADLESLNISGQAFTFDPENLYVKCKLQSTLMQDEQAEVNKEITIVERLGGSRELALERLGIENFSLNQLKRGSEDIFQGMVGAKVQEMALKTQAAVQQSMQNPQNPQNQINQMNSQTSAAAVQGQDMRAGGQAPPPGNTFEQVTGNPRQ